jgi:zinc protease
LTDINQEIRMRLSLFIVLLLLAIAPPLAAMTQMEDVKTFTLSNNMKVILLEDHSIPNASLFVFWRVGSRNEVPGITGLSHFFEHMMFNGAKKYGPKMFDRAMEAAGGSNNAYTTEDMTVYMDNFPCSATKVIFDLEADRIGHLAQDDKMVESERGVILSERSTGLENNNWELLGQQVTAAAFMAHPYRWPVIGYESDIKNWTKQDLQTYFATYYAPNNAVAVLVGDLTLDQVRGLTQEYLEPIPAHTPPRPVHTVEPEQLGEKRLWVNHDVSAPHLLIVYHVPQAQSPEYYALDVLNSILSEGNSSRLVNSLVDKQQLAVEISAYYPMSLDPTVFSIQAVAADGVSIETLEAAIYAQIETLITDGVTDRELQKAKNSKLVGFYHRMETLSGKANTLGTYELYFGDYRKLFSVPADYAKVTVDDVKAVAAKYLKKSNRTVGIL